ncbi:periodic tryptophan protein 2 [Vigna unguiculata]|uniref:Periodic tryptophan protein 2 n=1 Tax=Vigna unguiculata TaxID=3917 RepID=A0A4D6MIV8_VIGUN|nr:periodic tryptophan protein 2 [Vigna unguiculata]
MKSLNQELMFLILQFLDEEKCKDTVHKLEQESGLFFNIKYFEKKVMAGEWDEVEKYLFGFTKIDDNRYSMMIFFEIRKQKYLEALDRRDRVKAVEILVNDLKVFQSFNEYLFKEITNLLTLNDFRENAQLSKYGDTTSARNILVTELKRLIEANPLFQDKLTFPSIKASRLRTLINQSMNWQHQLCKNPMPNPNITTLFVNHSCSPANGSPSPSLVNLPMPPIANPLSCSSLGAHVGPFTPSQSASNANTLVGWTLNEIQSTSNDQGQLTTQMRPTQQHAEETTNNAPPPQQAPCLFDDLPRIVVCTLQQGSTITTMDFHPSLHSLLVVGCANGDISLWEAGHQEKISSNPFKIWNISICSVLFQIDAHVGGVNDLAFSNLNKQLCIVTCGDDKLIKVWDLNGKKIFNFEGHQAPVYSICPHQKENIQVKILKSLSHISLIDLEVSP